MIHFLLTLETDVILSASPGSSGQHTCLDYIPGSALWGVVAGKFYGKWVKESAWEKIRAVFHAGRVRFGSGFPATTGNRPMYPVPLSWHAPKGGGELHNLAFSTWNDREWGQRVQRRDGWFCVGPDNKQVVFKLTPNHRLKTAISAAKFDAPSEGQLFGYSSIPAGNRFVASVEADPDTPGWDEVLEFLNKLSTIRLGRSRTAEFGLARLEILADQPGFYTTKAPSPDGLTRLHLLTDLALCDKLGQPLLMPTSETLGLGLGSVDTSRTFLRFRSYSPWNRHRGCSDQERQVIAARSVVTLRLEKPQLDSVLRRGLYQAEGLGVIAVDPPYLVSAPPVVLENVNSTTRSGQIPDAVRALPLFEAMSRRYTEKVLERLAPQIGAKWKDKWSASCRHVSKSQWARVRHAAVTANNLADLNVLLTEIFEEGRSAQKK